MAHIVAECFRMAQNEGNWSKLYKKAQIRKIGSNGPEIAKMVQSAQRGQNWPKWPKLNKLHKVVKWSRKDQIANNCQNGPINPISEQNGPTELEWPKWPKIAQSGPDRPKLVQSVLSGLQWPRVLLKYICQTICHVCKVVSCTNTKTTPPPLFPVDTRCTRWEDKVAQEGKGGRWDACWQM